MISIVIPVYNEEGNVQPLYEEIAAALKPTREEYEVIFVDDGSNDATLQELTKLLQQEKSSQNLRIIELETNFGQTPALLAGLQKAKGEIIVTLDGDRQNDPRDIPKMLATLTEGYDVVCGWRKNRKDNLFKKIPSKINNLINQKMNHMTIHDSGCTLRVYRKKAIENLQLFAEEHRYIPAILAQRGCRLTEVETNHRPRLEGKTKYNFKRLFRGVVDLFTLRTLTKWGKKPMHFFSRWSFLLSVAGFLLFIWVLLERTTFFRFWSSYTEPVSIKINPLFLFSFLLFLTALLLLFLGFIAEILFRSTTKSEDLYHIRREWP